MPGRKELKTSVDAIDIDVRKEDEMLPDGAEQVYPPSTEGDEPDTAGEHGPMAPEAADALRRLSGERD